MAQAGFTPISLYFSTTAAAVPTSGNLANGELGINITDGKLYFKNNSGTVTLLASAAGSLGDVVGPASATDNALARFDTTTGKLIQNSVGILSDTGALSGITDIAASGSITLSGGTANGVAYLNGSKVLTTGSALVFDGTNLGIGTASPTNPLHIVSNTVSQLNVAALSGNTNAQINLEPTGTGIALIGPANSVAFAFRTNATERMRLDSSGNLLVGSTSTIGTGGVFQVTSSTDTSLFKCTSSTTFAAIVSNVENTAARLIAFQYGSGGSPTNVGAITTDGTNIALTTVSGITFPATQVASAGANTLDDYEEGTWSSAVTNAANLTGTGSLDRAVYTKIGRLVTIVGRITGQTITTVTTGTAAGLTLPFAMIATDSIVMGPCRLSSSTEMIGIILDATGGDATSVNLNFPAAQVTATGAATFSFSLTYQASA